MNCSKSLRDLTRSCAADYFDARCEEEELSRLRQDENLRLRREELDEYYAAVQENDPSKRIRMLKYIEGEFAMYSPYWFWRKDPYKAEALKFRVDGLAREGISRKNAGELAECLAGIRENAELEDWANNIYLGMMYFTLGDKEKAVESVMCNIDFGFETQNSRRLLAKFERKTPPKKLAATPAKSPEAPKPEPVRAVREEPVLGAAFLAFAGCGLTAYSLGEVVLDHYRKLAEAWLTKAAQKRHIEAMYKLGEIYRENHPLHNEDKRWNKNAAVRGHIPSQRALSEEYRANSDSYMWAYLAYLCGGTENLGNKPYPGDYPISLADASKAEAEAQRMFDDIQHHKGGTQ